MAVLSGSVRHRIDGLEMSIALGLHRCAVRHRIDGLEKTVAEREAMEDVRHRIDGLETNHRPSMGQAQRSPSHRWFRNNCHYPSRQKKPFAIA